MSLYPNTSSKKIYIWYNFKQIRDVVLLLFFSEKTKRFEKVFIYANTSRWEIDVLRHYTDDEMYGAICERLQYLFESREISADCEAIDVEKVVESYERFLVSVGK